MVPKYKFLVFTLLFFIPFFLLTTPLNADDNLHHPTPTSCQTSPTPTSEEHHPTPTFCQNTPTPVNTSTPRPTPTSCKNTPTPICTIKPTKTPSPTLTPCVSPTEVPPSPTQTPIPTVTVIPSPTEIPTQSPSPNPTSTPTPGSSDNNNNNNNSNDNNNNSSNNSSNNAAPAAPTPAPAVGGVAQVLGTTTNYNPIIDGIKGSYGEILGDSTQLPFTAAPVAEGPKLPSDNDRLQGIFLSIPQINFTAPLYQASTVGDNWLIGDQEALEAQVNNGYFIYGHNSPTVFGHLNQLHIGDKFIRSAYGHSTTYQVVEVSRVSAQYQQLFTKITTNTMLLVSCDPHDINLRVVIKAAALK